MTAGHPYDPFADCLTMTEAAAKARCTRAAIHAAVKSGRLAARQLSNGRWLIRKTDFTPWTAARRSSAPRPFRLSPRQAEMLVGIYRGRQRALPGYSFFITTIRALERRGLLDTDGWPYGRQLTEEGKRIARLLVDDMHAEQEAGGPSTTSQFQRSSRTP